MALVVVFTAALVVSAALLFSVQPMFTRMVLPMLGGTPAVWNTSLVFYQAALLAGYVYAHITARWLGVRRQAALHMVLLLAAFLALPVGLPEGWTPAGSGSPILWLFTVLLVSVGLPFFVVSATAPMLQKWFSQTGHPDASDPYFLYAASNAGSIVALLGYPLLAEPYLRLKGQAFAWTGGYVLLVVLISACALIVWRTTVSGAREESPAPGEDSVSGEVLAPPDGGRRVWWVLLSFVPSSLLLGVTTHISTDIASVPLLWVVPLALYLLTFVIVFARRPVLGHSLMLRVQPILIVAVLALLVEGWVVIWWVAFPLHLAAFFVTAMVCHGELVSSRPPAADLTEFYIWMSVGGILGGVFSAIVAPVVFDSVAEYPLAIVLACLLRPFTGLGGPKPYDRALDFILPLLALVLLRGVDLGYDAGILERGGNDTVAIVSLTAVFCYFMSERPVRFGLTVGAVVLAGALWGRMETDVVYKERSFFGVSRVKLEVEGRYTTLYHGTTIHGVQSTDPARRLEPLAYYTREGPIGDVFGALSTRPGPLRVAVIGLGSGVMAGYARPGDQWTFYEVDPVVERIARDTRYFTFLEDSPAEVDVVLGDGRLSLESAPDGQYDLLVFDAFSSDAIPMHLITREALRLYTSKLADGGIMAFHISDRYLNLGPVLAALAEDAGLSAMAKEVGDEGEASRETFEFGSVWVVMARRMNDMEELAEYPWWEPMPTKPEDGSWPAPWTDDFSNILDALRWKM
ncbi:MAG: fused MFS/spermidine synthase [Thermodesulfobacteriota bacterium]